MHEFIYSKDDLVGILRNLVTTGEKWEGHKRTVEVADFWSKIISGKNHQDIILSLKPSEKAELKKQRVRLYNSRTKSVANKIANQIKEVYRSDNIFNEIYFTEKNDANADKVKKIQDSLNGFSGNKSVRQWLRDRYLRLNISDPNSYIVVNFTNTTGGTRYYPIEVRSKDVLDRQYLNGTLQYLAFVEKTSEKAVVDGKTKTLTAYKYWIFGHDYAILYHRCPTGAKGIGVLAELTIAPEQYSVDDATSYSWYYSDYQINAQQVPAFCVGYIPDPENDDKTFQSILYPAEELFKELIWKKNLYDITMTLHGIAQKFAFVPRCNYDDKALGLKCKEGRLTNGEQCGQCAGTGQMPFHTSEQDIICLTLPENGKDFMDLSKMIYYQPIPIEIITMLDKSIEQLEVAIPLTIFNTSQVDKGQLTAPDTATKILDDKNSTNNVLYDFGLADAAIYISMVTQTAIYGDNWREDLVIDYSYPNDFGLEGLSELFAQSDAAKNSPAIVKSKINGKIISKLCIDNKSAIHNYETREYWKPFSDGAQLSMVPEYDKSRILFIYFDQIFRTLEAMEFSNDEKKDLPFSSLPRDKQWEFISKEIDKFAVQYKQAKDLAPKITVPRTV